MTFVLRQNEINDKPQKSQLFDVLSSVCYDPVNIYWPGTVAHAYNPSTLGS